MSGFQLLEDAVRTRIEIENTFIDILKAFEEGNAQRVKELEETFSTLQKEARDINSRLEKAKDFQEMVAKYNADKKSRSQ